MDSLVKKSLMVPIRKLTSWGSKVKERGVWAKHGTKRRKRGRGGGRGGRRTPPGSGSIKDPSFVRSYQADLDKERKLREAMNAQKNAERAAMRAHFRRKHQLSKNMKDASRLRAAGGKVSLPRELTKMVRPETKTKDNSFSLLSAFHGLSLNRGVVTGSRRPPTQTAANGEACKVM